MHATFSGPAALLRHRREFLQLGAGLLVGAALPGWGLAQPAATTPRRRARACLLLFQVGGPYQADTFDPDTIDRELGYAEHLGFNSVRVFLHHLLWEQDAKGFLQRMDKFLGIAEKHKIGVMFVLFDSCWDPHPKLGKQPAPKPGLHNSGWVQSPGVEVL